MSDNKNSKSEEGDQKTPTSNVAPTSSASQNRDEKIITDLIDLTEGGTFNTGLSSDAQKILQDQQFCMEYFARTYSANNKKKLHANNTNQNKKLKSNQS